MSIQHHERDGCGAYVTTDGCPFCGADLGRKESLAKHLRGDCPGGESDE